MRMALGIATKQWDGWMDCVQSWEDHAVTKPRKQIVYGKTVLEAYQEIFEKRGEDIIGYIHDDVVCYEQAWDARILNEFADPEVGIVGLGGAIGHGASHLYRVPYHLPDLARQNFMSNMRNAEQHGGRFTGERDVAIIDGFAIFVRNSIIEKWGGWDMNASYFMYSEHLCCEARRQGYRIRLVGIDCEHLGGKSSGHIPASDNYEEAHKYFYEKNRDVMPYRIKE